MATISVEIKNLPQIQAAFRKAPSIMARKLDTAIKKSIFQIERESMAHTPVDTGRLRASHTTRFSQLKGELEPTAFYAFFVHQGTRYMKGRPFLYNAVNKEESNIDKNFQVAVQDTLDEIGGMT